MKGAIDQVVDFDVVGNGWSRGRRERQGIDRLGLDLVGRGGRKENVVV
jgi:hypothetical protein